MSSNLTQRTKTIRLKVDGTNWTGTAGTSDLTSESVDLQGYDGVRFIIGFGAITGSAVTSVKAQESAAANTGQADLAGTSQTIADTDDNKIAIIDIFRPLKRFANTVVDRGTQNAVVDFIIAELYSARVQPVSQDSTLVGSAAENFQSPVAGTA